MSRWTRSELLLALNLYFETPFGKQHDTYPPIVELAKVIGRSPGAVAMKMSNFTSLDPIEIERGISGLSGASKLDRELWLEFEHDQESLVEEIETLLEQQKTSGIASIDSALAEEYRGTTPEGETTRVGLVKQRRYQNFFRRVVLGSYGLKCCVTSNPIPALLRASHIVPWSESPNQRLNPRNGLCLSATLDAAFDRGLVTVSDDFCLLLSPRLNKYKDNLEIEEVFMARSGMRIELPEKNQPDRECLKWHRNNIFIG